MLTIITDLDLRGRKYTARELINMFKINELIDITEKLTCCKKETTDECGLFTGLIEITEEKQLFVSAYQIKATPHHILVAKGPLRTRL